MSNRHILASYYYRYKTKTQVAKNLKALLQRMHDCTKVHRLSCGILCNGFKPPGFIFPPIPTYLRHR